MPTFSAVTLDRLLDPSTATPSTAKLRPPCSDKKPIPLRLPSLYATPAITPLPDSPSSFPPTPYIVNHKRRGPRLLKTRSQPPPLHQTVSNTDDLADVEPETGTADVELETGIGEELHVITEAVSSGSVKECIATPSTPAGDFFDALEEISIPAEGATISYECIEDEICEMRRNVLTEIARRKEAEESVEKMRYRWERLSRELSLVGLSLPAPMEEGDAVEELCRQVVVARFVGDLMGRGCSRAEIEPQIERKDFEISRLCDRLQYYEAANREMSQRNQEAVEMARQHRFKQKRRWKWFWASIGLSVAIGTAAFTWSYLPQSEPPSSHKNDTAGTTNNEFEL